MKKVGVLFGGKSGEHEVSLVSAVNLINEVDRSKYAVVPIKIEKNGDWFKFKEPKEKITDVSELDGKQPTNPYDLKAEVNVVFPVIHGETGEDGCLQGLFEVFDIPYVGCGVEASVIGMNKRLAKDELSGLMGVVRGFSAATNVLNGVTNEEQEQRMGMLIEEAEKQLKYPMFVKPVRAGSSLGASKVENEKELREALKDAFKYDKEVLIEEFIKMVELEVALFDDGETLHVSDVGHIQYNAEFYDYKTKYEGDNSVMVIPAKVPDDISLIIKEYARIVYEVLGVKDYARVDFFYDSNNDEVYFNEINTSPGMTSKSMYPYLFKSKFEFKHIVNTLIKNNLE